MEVQVVDNVRRRAGPILSESIACAIDVRLAVAYVSTSGLAEIEEAVMAALRRGADVEFMVGMDPGGTEPAALRYLFDLSEAEARASL